MAPVISAQSLAPITTAAPLRTERSEQETAVEGREMTQAEINLRDARRNLAAERERRRTHGSMRSVKTLPKYREDLEESEM